MAGYDRALYQMYLAEIPMFSKCSAPSSTHRAVRSRLRRRCRRRVKEGDAGDAFHVIVSGAAKVRRGGTTSPPRARRLLRRAVAVRSCARNATITSVGSLTCVVMSRAAFATALDEIPAVRDALLHGMAHRIHGSISASDARRLRYGDAARRPVSRRSRVRRGEEVARDGGSCGDVTRRSSSGSS